MTDQTAPCPPPGWRRYQPVWLSRPVRWAFAGTLIARTAQTMLPLTILLVFRQRTGSFAAGGIAVAVCGLASVAGGPATARLVDRWGTRVLTGAAAVHAASLVLLAVAASPALSWTAVAAAGVSEPPLTAVLRARIVAGLPAERDRAAAFSLDAIATEALFVAGPVLVAAATAFGRTADALIIAGGLVVTGSALVTRTGGANRGASRPVPQVAAIEHPRAGSRWPGEAALLAPWLAIGAAQMGAIGFVEVAVTARIVHLGAPAAAGTVLAVWAAGSIAGGLIYGSRDWPGTAPAQLRVLSLLVAAGFALVSAAGTMTLLYPLMFTAGLACAPTATALTTSFSAHATRAGSFAALTSADGLGGSAGYAAAGLLLAHDTITTTILVGAALTAASSALVPARRPRAS